MQEKYEKKNKKVVFCYENPTFFNKNAFFFLCIYRSGTIAVTPRYKILPIPAKEEKKARICTFLQKYLHVPIICSNFAA